MNKKALLSIIIALGFLTFPKRVHAIIFLPALLLIPIAKLVAFVIAGFSIPAFSLGALWSKLANKPLKKALLIVIISLLLLAIVTAVALKIHNPSRPLV